MAETNKQLSTQDWNAIVDAAFDLDEANPYFGQTAEADANPAVSEAFNPDQARDDHGRWTDSGGGGEAASKAIPDARVRSANANTRIQAFLERIKQVAPPPQRALGPLGTVPGQQFGETTEQAWRDPKTGEWNGARLAYDQAAAEALITGYSAPTDRPPVATIMGGGTASGKTTLTEAHMAANPNQAVIDPDVLKLAIPEYGQLKAANDRFAAARVHEESSMMTKWALGNAEARGIDFLYDSTTAGNGGPSMVTNATKLGYKVNVEFADVPIETAMARAVVRAQQSDNIANFGRLPPTEAIYQAHYGSAVKFMQMKDMPEVASIKLYDNSQAKEQPPTLVYSRQGASPAVIHDAAKWATYQQKATAGEAWLKAHGS